MEVSDAVLKSRGEQGVLAAEVGVDGLFVGLGRRSDPVYPCTSDAVGAEFHDCGLQQAPPRVL